MDDFTISKTYSFIHAEGYLKDYNPSYAMHSWLIWENTLYFSLQLLKNENSEHLITAL